MRTTALVRMSASAFAILFGLATLFAGGRVLLGSDPGYLVFRPLLIYNTTMGLAYVATGWLLLRRSGWARPGAGAIFTINLLVLVVIVLVYRSGGGVAVDSLRAMSLRTAVWLLIFSASAWLQTRVDASPA